VRIQTLGVGTTAGTTIKVDGFTIATAADPTTLENVSSVTNGSYQRVSSSAISDVAKSINLHFSVVSEHTEISALFALGAALVLVLGTLVSLAWSGRVV
jgi:Ca-activated chloride channel family protein